MSMIEVGNIVTLENGAEYLLLEELEHEENKFVYAVEVDDEEPTGSFLIFKAVFEDGDEYLKVVADVEELDILYEMFKAVVAEKLMNGEYDDELD